MTAKLRWLAMISTGIFLALTGASASGDEPRQGPAEETPSMQKGLGRLVGNWDVTVEYQYGDKLMKGTATCEAKWILDQRFVQQDYTSVLKGKPLHILQLIGYDDVKKKLIEIHLANNRNQVTINEGDPSEDGKVWTNVGEMMSTARNKAVKLRTVYEFKDADSFTLEWFQPDAEGKEVRMVGMRHVRRK